MPLKKQITKILKTLKKFQKGIRRTNLNREAKELKNYTPYQTLISCLLSLRVKDETAERISRDLFKIADTPEKILRLSNKKLEKIIYSSGYYKNKAKTLKKVSSQILKEHNGKIPRDKNKLLSLYGVGPKTANIVLCFCFNKNVIPVDVNVHRISNRLGWLKTQTAEKTEKELEKILPNIWWREINGLFILHGKNICLPVSPKCSICPISEYCRKIDVNKSR
jgi:endonuclease-3